VESASSSSGIRAERERDEEPTGWISLKGQQAVERNPNSLHNMSIPFRCVWFSFSSPSSTVLNLLALNFTLTSSKIVYSFDLFKNQKSISLRKTIASALYSTLRNSRFPLWFRPHPNAIPPLPPRNAINPNPENSYQVLRIHFSTRRPPLRTLQSLLSSSWQQEALEFIILP
jgi:hypothetical protein